MTQQVWRMAWDLLGLVTFLAVMTGTPGPANMLLVAAAARHGPVAAAPFALGVILGMQLVAWPAGLGLLELAGRTPALYQALRWVCAAYIAWLAWQIAGARIDRAAADVRAPGFARGLLVHPLNPKAWAIAAGAFTQFVPATTGPFTATAGMAALMLAVGLVLQGLWFWGGSGLARLVAGRPAERWAMRTLAALTVASVAWALT
ncbi:MAG: LysE family translocator [Halofilum sp. (in: g-proteobacteria)]|nr:LysE family translocator [Halofilum sp. (in: g-proteobacteria)]